MISLETRIDGFDARSWHRLVTLFAPGLASRDPHAFDERAAQPGGTLFVLHHGGHIVRALHTHRGVVDPGAWPGPEGLGALAKEQSASFVVALESGAMEELYERIGGRIRLEDDPASVFLLLAGVVRELSDEGAMHLWPQLIDRRVPLPAPAVIERAFDFVLPEGRGALIVLFDNDRVDTSVLVRRTGPTIDRILGPEVLRAAHGPLGGDFRRDYRVIRPAIERTFGPLSMGLYAETATIQALLRDDRPGAWAEAIASRDIVMDPMPAWTAVAAGAGVVRAAAARSKGLMAGLGVLGALSPTVRRLKEVAETVARIDLEQLLGFNPFNILAAVLRRSSTVTTRDDDPQTE